MPRYHAHLYGRTKDAIGIFYWIDCTVDADDPETARLKLYEQYEHIQGLRLTEEPGCSGDHPVGI